MDYTTREVYEIIERSSRIIRNDDLDMLAWIDRLEVSEEVKRAVRIARGL